MKYKIIVSRFNEELAWLESDMQNCIIYNKGQALNLPNEICLPNVGRESETYLNYIINNYHNLPDIVIFTQGQISDHRKNGNIDYLHKIKNEAILFGRSIPITHYIRPVFSLWNPYWNLQKGKFYLKDNYKNNKKKVFISWFRNNIQYKYPNPIKIYPNGIFAIRKQFILRHSIHYYKRLIKWVNHQCNPAEGHFFERSWYYIF
jgi:hypothetical protein